MQILTTVRCHYTLMRMSKKTPTKASAGEDTGQLEQSYIHGGSSLEIFNKVEHKPTLQPSNATPRYTS